MKLPPVSRSEIPSYYERYYTKTRPRPNRGKIIAAGVGLAIAVAVGSLRLLWFFRP